MIKEYCDRCDTQIGYYDNLGGSRKFHTKYDLTSLIPLYGDLQSGILCERCMNVFTQLLRGFWKYEQ